MARKAKRKMHQMPPLSFIDQLIYWTILIIICTLSIFLIFAPLYLRKEIAFSDSMVIAKEDHISMMWMIVPWMTFFLITFILWAIPYGERKPIFGKRNFKYGPPAWPRVYPLFMKNKPYVRVRKKAVETRYQIAVILLVVLLISFIPFPWSLYGRDCLHSDGSIHEYNMFNSKVRETTSGQIDEIEFEVYSHRRGKNSVGRRYDVRVHLTAENGKKYTFDYTEFRQRETNSPPFWLTDMLRLKTRYNPEIIKYSGTKDLYSVIDDNRLNETEAVMLYKLFEIIP